MLNFIKMLALVYSQQEDKKIEEPFYVDYYPGFEILPWEDDQVLDSGVQYDDKREEVIFNIKEATTATEATLTTNTTATEATTTTNTITPEATTTTNTITPEATTTTNTITPEATTKMADEPGTIQIISNFFYFSSQSASDFFGVSNSTFLISLALLVIVILLIAISMQLSKLKGFVIFKKGTPVNQDKSAVITSSYGTVYLKKGTPVNQDKSPMLTSSYDIENNKN